MTDIILDSEEFNLNKIITYLNQHDTIDYNIRFQLVAKSYFALYISLPNIKQINLQLIDEISNFVKIVWIVPSFHNVQGITLECISWKQRKAQEKENPNN